MIPEVFDDLKYDFANKKMLHFAAGVAESIFFQTRGAIRDTIDIRPESGCDIIADMCAMDIIQSDSYDLVFAVGVLCCVHDDEAAIGEVYRVLRTGGSFICSEADNNTNPAKTKNLENPIACYGEEALKNKVAFFRYYGEADLTLLLKRHFDMVECCEKRDIITGKTRNWYRCVK